jgi:outer membrane protein OmpA-like peptidoglycan-associated protein
MSAGILNKDLYVNGVKTTTAELRNRLLGRNLPPPIPNSLRETEFASYFGSLGQVISLPNPLIGEYVPKVDEGEYPLEDVSNEEREKQLLLNIHNAANEEEYNQYNFNVPPTPFPYLPAPYESYYDVTNIRSTYPVSLNLDRFKLVATGDEIGRRDPYQLIQTNDVTTNTESFLGIIGMERLKSSILDRKAQIIESEFIQPNKTLSALKNGANVDSYDITIPKDKVDKAVTFINYLDGSETPYSQLPDEAVGWQEYSQIKGDEGKVMDILGSLGVKSDTALSTEARNNEMLSRTSDGQKLLLYTNLGMNKFIPKYEDPRLSSLLGSDAPKSRYYIGDDRSTNRGDTLTKVFKSEQFNDSVDTEYKTNVEDDFFWKLDGGEFNPDTLLGKTQKLVNDNSDRIFINQTDKFFKDTIADKYISRGSAIKSNDNDATSFFRTWTVERGYSYENAIKKTGLQFKKGSIGRDKDTLSVLQANGIVKTHPTSLDRNSDNKKFMFSIENLAWSDNWDDLPPCERGNGDPISGNKGRIMWFPPYDLQFDENVAANWTSTEFIGRGEPLYTYNNTKRSGQLRFKMLVDHPSVINEFRGRQSDLIEKLFAGGRTVDEFMDNANLVNVIDINTMRAIENAKNSSIGQALSAPNIDTAETKIYFDPRQINPSGSNAKNQDWDNNSTSNGLYKDIIDNAPKNDDDEPIVIVDIKGYASNFEYPDENLTKKELKTKTKALSQKRIDEVEKVVLGWGVKPSNIKTKAYGATKSNKKEFVESDMRVDFTIKFEPRKIESENQNAEEGFKIDPEKLANVTIDECNFFDIIDDSYPNYFKTISEKIKYFQPAFHSMTPEGLNSRMTFLHQCMRQGPSIYDNVGGDRNPQNLAFGRPPVCILRIGDFFYSKVIINSLSINHAGGGSIQWDLNPEGVGVQPMVVDVNLSIDIIGGQSLLGPINRIQNALSFNYYANTEFYDRRSDKIQKQTTGSKIIDGYKPNHVPPEKEKNITIDDLTRREQRKKKREQRKRKKELERLAENSSPRFTGDLG